jgi:hypothetical protein
MVREKRGDREESRAPVRREMSIYGISHLVYLCIAFGVDDKLPEI